MSEQAKESSSVPASGLNAPTDAEIMYDANHAAIASGYAPELSHQHTRLRDARGYSDAESESVFLEVATGFSDAKINPTLASTLYGRMVHHAITPPDDATAQGWEAQSRQRLREQYGEADGNRRMEIAKEFIKNRPAFAQLLRESRMGSHVDVISAIAERANSIRVKPVPRRAGTR